MTCDSSFQVGMFPADTPLDPLELEEQQMFREHREVYGDSPAGIACYLGHRSRAMAGLPEQSSHKWPGAASPRLEIVSFSFASRGRWADTIKSGDPLDITFRLATEGGKSYRAFTSITLWTEGGYRGGRIQSPDDIFVGDGKPRPYLVKVDPFPWGAGTYDFTISIYDVADREPGGHSTETRHDSAMRCHRMVVTDDRQIKAVAYPSAAWTFR